MHYEPALVGLDGPRLLVAALAALRVVALQRWLLL